MEHAPLNAFQIRHLRDALVALEAELVQMLASSDEGSKPVDLDSPIGRISRMDAMQQQSMVKAGRERAQLRLQTVHAALALDPEDEYGYCRSCDEPIGYKRLKVRPETPFCVTCQQELERR